MTDADALLAAVLAEPDRDDVRLVYADWLEEHGEPERAEFIRVQLARAAQRPGQCVHGECPDAAKCCEVWCEGSDRLRRRERELLLAHGHAWLAGLGIKTVCHDGGEAEGVNYEIVTGCEKDSGIQVDFRRGFVESVRCSLADWRAHGPAVVRRQPVTRVDVTDRRPWLMNETTVYWCPESDWPIGQRHLPWELPLDVYSCLPITSRTVRGGAAFAVFEGEDTTFAEAAARAALSAALCLWAKRPAAAAPAAGAGR